MGRGPFNANLVALAVVWAMLDHCAPGYERVEGDHYWRVMFEGKTYPRLPLGKHGSRKANVTDVEVAHVRRMARVLGIEACMWEFFDGRE